MLFLLLNLPSVQEAVKERIVAELKTKLETDLGIEKIYFHPFNNIQLNGVYLNDRQNEKILTAENLYASIDLFALLKNEVVITAVRLNDFEIDLSKESKDSQLNVQFVIDAFKPKADSKKTSFDIKINSVSISDGRFRFDIKDQAYRPDLFDQNHIQVSDLNASLALKSLKADSLNIQIKRLSLKEKSGVEIKNLIARAISSKNKVDIKGFRLELPHSLLLFDKCQIDFPESSQSVGAWDKATFRASIVSSYVTPKDVSGFTSILRNFKDRILMRAEVDGTIDQMNVSNLTLDYGDKMNLVTNAQINNLRNKDSLFVSGNVEKLLITAEGINGLVNNFSDKAQTIPKEITNLGNISFKGNISGHLDKLNAHGLLATQLGNIQTDLLFGFNLKDGTESFFNGKIHTSDFDLNSLIDNDQFGKLSFDLLVDLKKPKNKKLGGKVQGLVSQFDYRGYAYQNITLNGKYDGLKIEGEANIDDENVFLDIDGLFDLSNEQPELNFVAKLKNLRLDKLNLSQKYDNSYLSLNLNANFSGRDIDNAEGFINIDSLRFYRNGEVLRIDKFLVTSDGAPSDKRLEVESDIINGHIAGAFSFSSMLASLKKTFNPYLPVLIPIDDLKKKKIAENNLSLNLSIGNTERLSSILSLPFTIFSEVSIAGFYNNINEKFQLEIFYPSAKIGGMTIKSGYFLAENSDNVLKSNISGIVFGKNNIQNDLNIDLSANQNTVNSLISFSNNSKQTFKGSFSASTLFSRESKNSPLCTNINISPSDIVLNDTLWQIDKSKISINPSFIAVEDFNIHNKNYNQYISIAGKYVPKADSNDALKIDLKDIDLSYVFNTLAIDALNFGGYATGTLQAQSIDQKPYLDVNLNVRDFSFNDTPLGNLNVYSEFEEKTRNIKLNGVLLDKDLRKTGIDGYINPVTQELSLKFDADKVNIGFLNKYASSLFNNIKGIGSGKVHLYGNFSNVTVTGKAFVENGSLGINFLNTNYSFSDTIYMKEDLIYFNNITFSDQQNNKAQISGKVVHDFFSNFMYYVELSGKNFMLYNATENLNPMFHGKLYGTGNANIGGDERVVNINAQVKTDSGSRIRMNFMEETINEYSFISYKNNNPTQDDADAKGPKTSLNALKTESGMEVNMNFYVDATPDAVVEIVMDPVGGDILRCAGSGALQFVWSSKTDPKLYGTYVINNGSYNFTFQKIIERKFSIETGSSVLFQGNPFLANLDVNAIYKLNANLNDLDSDLARRAGQSTVPVECILNITSSLQHPNIKLDVALPSADAEVQRQVKSLMNNDDMVNRQMVYLLLLSKFYTPNNTNAEHRSSDFASLASATLSTQLSKVLSTIDDRWQIGTNIRTSDAGMTNTEVELLLSSQLLNNRVLLNGNFGYRDDPNASAAFIGDVDIEVLLNQSGTWRAKAYNHYNEKYYYVGSSIQTQGVGIMYKKNFDYLREVFGQNPKYKMLPKTDSIKAIIPDSTVKGSSLSDFIKIK